MSEPDDVPIKEMVRPVSADEEAMEPVELIEQSGAIMRTGRLMLAAGTASYRVAQAMQAVAQSLGVDAHHAQVSLTDITATSRRGRIFRTELVTNSVFSVNTDRIVALDRMRRTMPEHTTAAEVHKTLDNIEARGARYPVIANAAFAGAACGGFALLNHARLLEIVAVFLAAGLGQYVRRLLMMRHFNIFGVTMAAAAVATGVYMSSMALLNVTGVQVSTHAAGYISAVLFLLPGFALITGALDMAKMDITAGISRIAFGTMITLGATVSVWAVSLFGTLEISERPEANLPVAADIALWAGGTAVGVLGFALMFNSAWRLALSAAAIGAIANTGRLFAMDQGVAIQTATAAACVLVGVLAAWAARGGRFPVITLSVPAVLVMVPGVTAHEAVVSLNRGDYGTAVAGVLLVVLVVLSIMVGLVVAKLLTDREWAFTQTEQSWHHIDTAK
ncbi:threonine/serine ThrE exporter family protein [Demequina aurantiaca]|uniref:threonine/serine ThrE exporter family protein n=1 Tax=Demequina aurantiaca TaxID=676200 RepID=UPI001364D7B2|nr:threonine/serine exporter family protein [Demequina aurantiaca]